MYYFKISLIRTYLEVFCMNNKDIFDYMDEIKDAWHSELRSSRALYYWIFLFWANMFFQKLFDAVAILSRIDFKTLKLNSSVLIALGTTIAPVVGIGALLYLLKSKIVFEYRVEHFTKSITEKDIEELLAKIIEQHNKDDQDKND